jgi:hypothetical protein
MTFAEKSMLAIGSGVFLGTTLWLWSDTGESVFITRALAFVQTCL